MVFMITQPTRLLMVNQIVHFYCDGEDDLELEHLRSMMHSRYADAKAVLEQIKQRSPFRKWKIVYVRDDGFPHAGDVVRLAEPGKGWWQSQPVGTLAVIDGMIGQDMSMVTGRICFGAIAYRNDRVVQCSGGPASVFGLKTKNLRKTDELHRQWYWRSRGDQDGAHRGINYSAMVPIWDWNGDGE